MVACTPNSAEKSNAAAVGAAGFWQWNHPRKEKVLAGSGPMRLLGPVAQRKLLSARLAAHRTQRFPALNTVSQWLHRPLRCSKAVFRHCVARRRITGSCARMHESDHRQLRSDAARWFQGMSCIKSTAGAAPDTACADSDSQLGAQTLERRRRCRHPAKLAQAERSQTTTDDGRMLDATGRILCRMAPLLSSTTAVIPGPRSNALKFGLRGRLLRRASRPHSPSGDPHGLPRPHPRLHSASGLPRKNICSIACATSSAASTQAEEMPTHANQNPGKGAMRAKLLKKYGGSA